MLNTAERFKILKAIRHCCIVGYLPAIVDLSSWQLLQHSITGRRRWPSLTYLGVFMLHCLYKIGTLLRACFIQNDTALHQLTIHAVLAVNPLIFAFWYYQLYINSPGAFSTFFRITLTGDIEGIIPHDGETKGLFTRLKEYTLQDFFAINLTYMSLAVVALIIVAGIYDPTLQFLLYAGLPKQVQTWLTFAVLMFEELRYMLIICAVIVPVFTLQIISFDLVNNQLKLLMGLIKRTRNIQKLQSTYRQLRRIQLYITVINLGNRHIIFTWKLLCIGMSIGCGYSAITHFHEYPIFGVMYYLLLSNCTFIYTVGYGKAFRIPVLFKEAAQYAVFRLHQGSYGDKRVFKRQMLSIPRVGIKVGEFHVLERASTLIFTHYVLSNIASMLVAYKH